jgi:hypothetical protein
MTALDDLRFETRFRACSIHPPTAPPRMRRPNAATANRSVKPADDENLKQKPLTDYRRRPAVPHFLRGKLKKGKKCGIAGQFLRSTRSRFESRPRRWIGVLHETEMLSPLANADMMSSSRVPSSCSRRPVT